MRLIQYKVWCNTEADWVYTQYIPEDDGAPTECPNNNGHTLDQAKTVEVEVVDNTFAETVNHEQEVVVKATPGEEIYFFSWSFTDECEWVENAVLVEDFEMTDSGDRITWNTNDTHLFWIDIVTGRIIFQDTRFYDMNLDGSVGTVLSEYADYLPVVKVLPNGQADEPGNWVIKVYGTDYGVNFKDGKVIFASALDVGDRVQADFRKSCGTYQFTLEPCPGKELVIEYAEAHAFNYKMTGWISREITMPIPEGGGVRMVVPGTMKRYYRFIHLILDSTGSWPDVAGQAGGNVLDSYNSDVLIGTGDYPTRQLPFRFLAVGALSPNADLKYIIRLEKKWEPLVPEDQCFANIVLYCTQHVI